MKAMYKAVLGIGNVCAALIAVWCLVFLLDAWVDVKKESKYVAVE